jgi:glycosyltransferase involved in cell wall biosynthesis
LPKVRFFHDHRLFCLRNYKYTALGHQTCTRTVGLGCYPCLGFVNKSSGWPGLKLSFVSTLRAQQRATMFFDAFVVGSRYMAGHVVAHGFDRARVHVIPPFAEPPPNAPTMPREPDLLLFVGQLIRGKGLDVLLRALTKVRTPVRLVVVGTGRQGSVYQRLTEKLALTDRVKFVGRMPPEQLAELYPRATAVVFPSRSPETFGLVGIEAMSHGTPVIASAVGGIGEWLQDGRVGIAVPSGDPAALARAIDRLVGDPGLVRAMGAEGLRRYQERFRPERHVECLHALFAGLAGSNGKP